MKHIIQSADDLIKAICQPDPKVYPDASVQQFIWKRNVQNIYICTFFLMFYIVFSAFNNFSTVGNVYIIGGNLFQLIAFVVLCRSYLWIFNILFVGSSLMLGFAVLNASEEAVYFYLGFVFVLLPSILIMSGGATLTLLAGLVQIFICLTKFKEKLGILIEEEHPEIFTTKFSNMLAFFFIVRLLFNINFVRTMDRRAVELSSAKIALEKALDQQKTFIFSFSHELRNPINSLLGNLQLVLQGEALSSKAAEMINIAKVCGELLLHNINNVLDTGKHDIGKLEVNPVPTQLHEQFQRTWGIYNELLRQKKLQSQLKIENGLPGMVKIDSHKVDQILLNLIGNSIKFTEKGSVAVTIKWLESHEVSEDCFEPIPYDEIDEGLFEKDENVSTVSLRKFSDFHPGIQPPMSPLRRRGSSGTDEVFYPEQETQGILKIIVKDTGSGMSKEALEKLFKKFSQVSDDASQRQIGTGLGLFITKEICLAMNGEIRAYSKPKIGSTFIVCIPTVALPLSSRFRADSTSMINQLSEKHLQALVADDSPFNVNLTCNYFAKFGATVVSVAYNGCDAYIKYKECHLANMPLDVVTLDIDMPVMDGRTACEKIREYEKKNNLKPATIILISGNYDKAQVNEYLDPMKGRRADCFLRKPISFGDFNRAIYNLMSQSS